VSGRVSWASTLGPKIGTADCRRMSDLIERLFARLLTFVFDFLQLRDSPPCPVAYATSHIPVFLKICRFLGR